MVELLNFPFLSQLDHDVNEYWDCVPTSIAAGLEYHTGKKYSGGELKDAVYGAGFKGATAAYMYVEYCAKQGVRLFPINGSPQYLVGQAHAQLAQLHPVVFTEPDPYAAASLGWTHVCVFFKENTGTLTSMDPYIDKAVERTDTDWAMQLRFNQIWIMEKMDTAGITIPAGWHDDGVALIAPNGIKVVLGFRQYILSQTDWHPENIPLEAEMEMKQLETGNPALGGGSQQVFRECVLEYTPTRGVFAMWVGQEILVMRGVMNNMYAQLVALRQQPPADPLAAECKAALKNLQPLVAKL